MDRSKSLQAPVRFLVFDVISGLTLYPDRGRHARVQHIAFEYATLDDLLGTYIRLKNLLVYVDPEKLIPARKSGLTAWEVHQRANAGEYVPTKPYDLNQSY